MSHLEQPNSGRPHSPPKNPGKYYLEINRSRAAAASASASVGGAPFGSDLVSHAKLSGEERPPEGEHGGQRAAGGGGHARPRRPPALGRDGDHRRRGGRGDRARSGEAKQSERQALQIWGSPVCAGPSL